MDLILVVLALILCMLMTLYIWKRDKFYAFYYMALILYAFPALIGYRFFPNLSVMQKAYFGEKEWMSYFLFVIISFVTFTLFFHFFYKIPLKRSFLKIEKKKHETDLYFYVALIFIVFAVLVQIVNLIVNKDMISWENIANAEIISNNMLMKICSSLFKISVGYNLILYFFVRSRCFKSIKKNLIIITFTFSFAVFLFYAFKSGNRTDLVAFFLGFMMIESYLGYFNKKTVIKYLLLMIIAVGFMMAIAKSRDRNFGSGLDSFAYKILAQDYYAPEHILFAAMHLKVIEPMEVIKSNFCNSLVMLGYPYLQQGVTEMFNPGVATRNTGYAFYIFTEGYLFIGKLGWLYNGLVLNLGLRFWRRISNSKDKEFNHICIALMAAFSINLVRGQSSYFIKYLYTNLIFNLILYFLISGKHFKIVFSNKRR